MEFSFTPQAAKKLQAILAEKGGNLAIRIEISRGALGMEWRMTLEPAGPDVRRANGVPVLVSPNTLKQMDGLVIDWVMTPEGPGLGVYDKNLLDRELR